MFNLLVFIVLGWLGGALVNYLSDVLPSRRRPEMPFCHNCEREQNPVNYFFWPRRCPECGRRRALRVWLVELVGILAGVWLYYSPPARFDLLTAWLLLVYFGVVVVIDLEHRLILHPVSLVGAVLGAIVGIRLRGIAPTLIGGLAGFALMFGVYLLGILFVRFMARRRGQTVEAGEDEALGFGDVALSAVLGLLLGWPGIMAGLVTAILLGGVFSLFYLILMIVARRYRFLMAIPYGPFLIASGFALLFLR